MAEPSVEELRELQRVLNARLVSFDGGYLQNNASAVTARKNLAMQAAAAHLVPKMNELQASHEQKEMS